MGDRSKIEWTDASWNPVVGCSIISPGCTNCYAMRMAARLQKMNRTGGCTGYVNHYDGTTQESKAGPVWTGKVALAPEKILRQPLSWKRPRRIFVNSMGDLFHEDMPDEFIDRIFAVMALAPQHTFQILTKRADRMRAYMRGERQWWTRRPLNDALGTEVLALGYQGPLELLRWPLPNVWLGVSVEDQARADERIPLLLKTPAAVRFISAEPLLGPVNLVSDLGGTLWIGGQRGCGGLHQHGGRAGETIHGEYHASDPRLLHHHHDNRCLPGLDWVISGGENGPRPSHPDWHRGLRDQCASAAVPYHFKGWGTWKTVYDRDHDDPDWRNCPHEENDRQARYLNLAGGTGFHGERVVFVRRTSKKAAGRLLDGIEHNGFPEVSAHA